jgi:DNA primase
VEGETQIDILKSVLDYLKSDGNIVENGFQKRKDSGDNLMMCCPFHKESKPSFGISKLEPNQWQCFSCGLAGNLVTLVKNVMGLATNVHAEHFIKRNFYETVEKREVLDIENLISPKKRKTNDDYKSYQNERHPYLYRRGFIERTLQKYEVGYDKETKTMVMPVRDTKGEIRFMKRRSVEGKFFLNETGVQKKDVLYGLCYLIMNIENFDKVFITESETDTLACYQVGLPCVSTMGRILTKEQVRELLRVGVKSVVLFFDNDSKGKDATLKAYEILSQTPIKTYFVVYPDDSKDANDLLKCGNLKSIKVETYEEYYLRLNRGI